jgi:hypothetical protein
MSKPAKAPRPGIGARNEEANAASKILELTLNGDTYQLGLGTISMDDRALVRRTMKAPIESFLDAEAFGVDSLFVIWWLARRHSGEFNLSYAEAAAQFPTSLEPGDVSLDVVDPDGDDPEA